MGILIFFKIIIYLIAGFFCLIKAFILLFSALNKLVAEYRNPHSNLCYVLTKMEQLFKRFCDFMTPASRRFKKKDLISGLVLSSWEALLFSFLLMLTLTQTLLVLIGFSDVNYIQKPLAFPTLIVICSLLGLSLGYELRTLKCSFSTLQRNWPKANAIEKSKVIAAFFSLSVFTVLLLNLNTLG